MLLIIRLIKYMGTWYAIRGIEHNNIKADNYTRRTKLCPTVTLSLHDGLIEFKWQAKDKPIRKVDLKQNSERPGLWQQNKKGKAPFSSLQMSLIPGHKDSWVATMCRSHDRKASVVLSRQPEFNEEIVNAASDLLKKYGLNIDNAFDRCAAT